MRDLLRLGRKSFSDFFDDDCMSSGAAMAFYTIFSLPPLLVVVITIAGLFGVSPARVGEAVQGQAGLPLVQSLRHEGNQASNGEEATRLSVARQAAQRAAPVPGVVGQGVGLVMLLFSATAVLAQLQYSLNRAWEVEPDPEQGGVKRFLFKRVLSLGMILAIAFLLLTSLVISTLIDQIVGYLQGVAPSVFAQTTSRVLNAAASFVLGGLLFAGMYKFFPDVEMRWRDVWIGAAVTSLLFVVGKWVISWYLRTADIAGGWDSAAASVVAVLVWVYYSSLIVLFGAEVTQVWANQFGRGARPEAGAVRTVRGKQHLRDS
jgi:membrane protein